MQVIHYNIMKRNIARTIKSLIFVSVLTLFAACDSGDDVEEIFVGHDWKLTYIEDGSTRRWPSQEREYSLRFTGSGFTATTPGGGSINGRWQADGKTREFRCSDIRTSSVAANDTIAQLMIQLLREAVSYDGDIHYLQIIKEKNHLMQFYNR